MIDGLPPQAPAFSVEKTIVCGKVEFVMDSIVRDYRETPLVVAKNEDSYVVFLSNEKTKTWTIIQFDKKIACVLETGQGYVKSNE